MQGRKAKKQLFSVSKSREGKPLMCHSKMFLPDTAREKRNEEDGLEGKWDVSKVKGKKKKRNHSQWVWKFAQKRREGGNEIFCLLKWKKKPAKAPRLQKILLRELKKPDKSRQ